MKKSTQTQTEKQEDRQTDIPRLCFSLSAWLDSSVQDTAGDRTLGTCHSATVATTTTTTSATTTTLGPFFFTAQYSPVKPGAIPSRSFLATDRKILRSFSRPV